MSIQIVNGAPRRPQIPLIVLLCGLAGAIASSAASAAPGDEAPSQVKVKFSPAMLATEDGARSVYHRIVKAAELACPDMPTDSRIPNQAVLRCREQAVARAVHQINNPQLAEVYSASTKHG
jgi:UrcA family protein